MECRASRRDALQPLHFLRPDDQLVLCEALLELLAKALPPRPVERVDHDFIDDDVIALRRLSILGPEPLRGGASVCRQPAEPFGELGANGVEVRTRKGLAFVVVEREQELNEVDMASGAGMQVMDELRADEPISLC